MATKLRAAVIGYGRVGRVRRACIERHPALELAAVCDADAAQTAEVTGCSGYSDWREVIAARPDLVFVCTTNELIPVIAAEALSHGIHTFCEKPPGRNVDDVRRIIAAESGQPGVKLKFGFNHRYHQSVMDALGLVERGRLGKILWLRGIYGKAGGPQFDKNWRNDPERSGGGILIDQGIHMLDLFHLFGGRFQEVKSLIGRSFWKVPVEDNVFALLRNDAGQMAMIHSSATQWRHTFVFDIYLERGYLSLNGILSSTQSYGRETLKIARCQYNAEGYPLPNPLESVTYYDDDRSWELEVDEFVQCILENRPVGTGNSKDALAAMELVEAIYSGDSHWPREKAVALEKLA